MRSRRSWSAARCSPVVRAAPGRRSSACCSSASSSTCSISRGRSARGGSSWSAADSCWASSCSRRSCSIACTMREGALLTTSATPRERVMREFAARYGAPPAFIARGPGRVNLIGDHTDYNDGFVLPMAIDRAVWIAFRPRSDSRVSVHSLDFNETREFDLASGARAGRGWVEYVRGVGWALRESGRPVCGWDGVTMGDVPVGAGLSSSAALELAAARAFTAYCDQAWKPAEMALLAQRAENDW